MGGRAGAGIDLEILPAMRIASIVAVSASPEEEASATIDAWLERQGIDMATVRRFGLDVEVPADAGQGVRGYEVWRTIPDDLGPSEGVAVGRFEGGLHACLTLTRPFPPEGDPFVAIPRGWAALHEWVLANEDVRAAERPWLEELLPTAAGSDLRLYLPVDRAGGS